MNRINGFEQIKAFYSWVFNNQDMNVKPQHTSLYHFLLNQNNRNNWVEWFQCPFDLGMAGSRIGNKKTYYKCLNDLAEWKLIGYKPGINEYKAPLIRIEVLNRTSTETAGVPQGTPLSIPLPTPLPTHIYKLITLNLKPITDNIESILEFLKIPDLENRFDEIREKIEQTGEYVRFLMKTTGWEEQKVREYISSKFEEWKANDDTSRSEIDYRTHITNSIKKDCKNNIPRRLSAIEAAKAEGLI